VKVQRHHIFPQAFRERFEKKGIDIHRYTVEMTEGEHLQGVHGRGNLLTPGRWNERWDKFFLENPDPTAVQIYQFGGKLMDEYGLSNRPIVPYR
jgi:hypothetical protein